MKNPLAIRGATGTSLLVYESERGAIRAALRYRRSTLTRVEFALDVVNAGDSPILATLYAVVHDAQEIPLPPYSFWIEAHTDGYIDLPLSWFAAFTTRALSVRLQGPSVHQRLEADMPRPSSLLWFLAGACIALLVFAAASLAHGNMGASPVPSPAARPSVQAPRIIAFTLDRAAIADGGTVVAHYRMNADSGAVLAVDAQGAIVAERAIHDSRGVTSLAIPAVGRDRDLQIRLVARRGSQLVWAGVGIESLAR